MMRQSSVASRLDCCCLLTLSVDVARALLHKDTSAAPLAFLNSQIHHGFFLLRNRGRFDSVFLIRFLCFGLYLSSKSGGTIQCPNVYEAALGS
jgi:hypothetical protein